MVSTRNTTDPKLLKSHTRAWWFYPPRFRFASSSFSAIDISFGCSDCCASCFTVSCLETFNSRSIVAVAFGRTGADDTGFVGVVVRIAASCRSWRFARIVLRGEPAATSFVILVRTIVRPVRRERSHW